MKLSLKCFGVLLGALFFVFLAEAKTVSVLEYEFKTNPLVNCPLGYIPAKKNPCGTLDSQKPIGWRPTSSIRDVTCWKCSNVSSTDCNYEYTEHDCHEHNMFPGGESCTTEKGVKKYTTCVCPEADGYYSADDVVKDDAYFKYATITYNGITCYKPTGCVNERINVGSGWTIPDFDGGGLGKASRGGCTYLKIKSAFVNHDHKGNFYCANGYGCYEPCRENEFENGIDCAETLRDESLSVDGSIANKACYYYSGNCTGSNCSNGAQEADCVKSDIETFYAYIPGKPKKEVHCYKFKGCKDTQPTKDVEDPNYVPHLCTNTSYQVYGFGVSSTIQSAGEVACAKHTCKEGWSWNDPSSPIEPSDDDVHSSVQAPNGNSISCYADIAVDSPCYQNCSVGSYYHPDAKNCSEAVSDYFLMNQDGRQARVISKDSARKHHKSYADAIGYAASVQVTRGQLESVKGWLKDTYGTGVCILVFGDILKLKTNDQNELEFESVSQENFEGGGCGDFSLETSWEEGLQQGVLTAFSASVHSSEKMAQASIGMNDDHTTLLYDGTKECLYDSNLSSSSCDVQAAHGNPSSAPHICSWDGNGVEDADASNCQRCSAESCTECAWGVQQGAYCKVESCRDESNNRDYTYCSTTTSRVIEKCKTYNALHTLCLGCENGYVLTNQGRNCVRGSGVNTDEPMGVLLSFDLYAFSCSDVEKVKENGITVGECTYPYSDGVPAWGSSSCVKDGVVYYSNVCTGDVIDDSCPVSRRQPTCVDINGQEYGACEGDNSPCKLPAETKKVGGLNTSSGEKECENGDFVYQNLKCYQGANKDQKRYFAPLTYKKLGLPENCGTEGSGGDCSNEKIPEGLYPIGIVFDADNKFALWIEDVHSCLNSTNLSLSQSPLDNTYNTKMVIPTAISSQDASQYLPHSTQCLWSLVSRGYQDTLHWRDMDRWGYKYAEGCANEEISDKEAGFEKNNGAYQGIYDNPYRDKACLNLTPSLIMDSRDWDLRETDNDPKVSGYASYHILRYYGFIPSSGDFISRSGNTIHKNKAKINEALQAYQNQTTLGLSGELSDHVGLLDGDYWGSTQANASFPAAPGHVYHYLTSTTGVGDLAFDLPTQPKKIRCAFSYQYYVPDDLENKYGLDDECIKMKYQNCLDCLNGSQACRAEDPAKFQTLKESKEASCKDDSQCQANFSQVVCGRDFLAEYQAACSNQ